MTGARLSRSLLLLSAGLLWHATAVAHPLAPSLLELRGEGGGRYQVLWKTPLRLPVDVQIEPVLPAQCQPTGAPESRREGTAVATRWTADCGSAGLAGARLGVSGLMPRGTGAVVRVDSEEGGVVQALLTSATPFLTVPEQPSGAGVLGAYLWIGIEHLWFGFDHVLFVLGLLLLVRSAKALLLTVTAFTLGHSVTLSVVALGFVEVPSSLIEVAIAGTLLLLAVELVPRERRSLSLFGERPWRMAFAFGLLHGFGFASALTEVGLPRSELLLALVSFNFGIEIGQLALIAVAIFIALVTRPVAAFIRKSLPRAAGALPRRLPRLAAAYGIGSLSGFWMVQRASTALFGS